MTRWRSLNVCVFSLVAFTTHDINEVSVDHWPGDETWDHKAHRPLDKGMNSMDLICLVLRWWDRSLHDLSGSSLSLMSQKLNTTLGDSQTQVTCRLTTFLQDNWIIISRDFQIRLSSWPLTYLCVNQVCLSKELGLTEVSNFSLGSLTGTLPHSKWHLARY